MRVLRTSLTALIGLLATAWPAHGCGLHGFYYVYADEGPDPWIPLIIFATTLFIVMFSGRALPRLSQGLILGILFALAGVLGVFSFSGLFYPGAFIAMIILIGVALFTVLIELGLRTKRDWRGASKYGVGFLIGIAVYVPMSAHLSLTQSNMSPMMVQNWEGAPANTKQRPTFTSSPQMLAQAAHRKVQRERKETAD